MLHAQLLGKSWDELPEPVRRCHTPGAYRGRIVVTHHSRFARVLGFPPAGETSIELTIEVEDDVQIWTRHFGDFEMKTTQYAVGDRLAERRGPIAMLFDLVVEDGALVYRQARASVMGPRVEARTWADGDAMRVKVAIAVPIVGPVVSYEGTLR